MRMPQRTLGVIAKDYVKTNNMEFIDGGDLEALANIYEEYTRSKTFKPLKVDHPLNRNRCVRNAISRSKFFECNYKINLLGHRYNVYNLKKS